MSRAAKVLMDQSAQVARDALETYNNDLTDIRDKLEASTAKASTLIEAAQAVCDHSHVTKVEWTEDGAYPNEPHSRTDCAICGKEGVM